jgi:hypothetical protein
MSPMSKQASSALLPGTNAVCVAVEGLAADHSAIAGF